MQRIALFRWWCYAGASTRFLFALFMHSHTSIRRTSSLCKNIYVILRSHIWFYIKLMRMWPIEPLLIWLRELWYNDNSLMRTSWKKSRWIKIHKGCLQLDFAEGQSKDHPGWHYKKSWLICWKHWLEFLWKNISQINNFIRFFFKHYEQIKHLL